MLAVLGLETVEIQNLIEKEKNKIEVCEIITIMLWVK